MPLVGPSPGVNPKTGEQFGAPTGDPAAFGSWEDVRGGLPDGPAQLLRQDRYAANLIARTEQNLA